MVSIKAVALETSTSLTIHKKDSGMMDAPNNIAKLEVVLGKAEDRVPEARLKAALHLGKVEVRTRAPDNKNEWSG